MVPAARAMNSLKYSMPVLWQLILGLAIWEFDDSSGVIRRFTIPAG